MVGMLKEGEVARGGFGVTEKFMPSRHCGSVIKAKQLCA